MSSQARVFDIKHCAVCKSAANNQVSQAVAVLWARDVIDRYAEQIGALYDVGEVAQ